MTTHEHEMNGTTRTDVMPSLGYCGVQFDTKDGLQVNEEHKTVRKRKDHWKKIPRSY